MRMKSEGDWRPNPPLPRRRLVSRKLISVIFLLLLASWLRGVTGIRPNRDCRLPVSDTCVSFDPDPEPEEYPDVPNATDPFWDQPGNEAITQEDDIKFADNDKPIFHLPEQKLYRYFKSADIAGVSDLFEDAKFSLIEWPGKKSDKNPSDKDKSSFQDFLQARILGNSEDRDVFIPLNYQAHRTKFLGYLCNPQQGTHLRAVGFRMKPDAIDKEYRTYIPFYMTSHDRSFHKVYVHPLFALSSDFNKLAKDHDDPSCQAIVEGIVTPESKLTHIYDFTYTNGRLLLGMHCGIIIISKINTRRFTYESALLNPDPDPYDENAFAKDAYVKFSTSETYREQKFRPINMISASTCCPKQDFCSRQTPLAAAYSYDRFSEGTTRKFLYVSTDLGSSFDRKIVAAEQTVLHLIRGLYNRFLPNNPEPNWVIDEIIRLKNLDQWVDDDPISEEIINPRNHRNLTAQNGSCLEIVSMEVVAEQQSILALCRLSPAKLFNKSVDVVPEPTNQILPAVLPPIPINSTSANTTIPTGTGNATGTTNGTGSTNATRFGVYAVFELKLSKASPLIPIIRKTKRKLGCKLRPLNIVPGSSEFYEPRLVRSAQSFNLFMIGCKSVIYYSVNGGSTFWNAVFYRKYETGHYRRFHMDNSLDLPLTAFDPKGHSVVFCSGLFYAFGQMNYNRETRMVISRITTQNSTNITFESVTNFLPYYSNNGELHFAFVALHILRGPNADAKLRALYTGRNAIRLIDYPVQLSRALMPYYRENLGIRVKSFGFDKCVTFSWSLKPHFISFDLNDKRRIDVKVQDSFEDLPLGIHSSTSTALKFEVNFSNRTVDPAAILKHEWIVDVTALGRRKSVIQRHSDAFFGSEYSTFQSLATPVVFTALTPTRCHVQPSGSVYIDIGCAGKTLVAHEDYNRPQCPKFFRNFTTTYKPGDYDEDLMQYWLDNRPNFYEKLPNGEVKVRFDYETFGCPIQPYRLDPWAPDLRILDASVNKNLSDTAAGRLYNKSYVLIEVHGAGGFTYTMTNKEAGCVRPPQVLSQMMLDWKSRRQVLAQAFVRYRDFRPKAIDDPINIWNRINYRPCQELGDFKGEMSEQLNNVRYQIMQRNVSNNPEDGNRVEWQKRSEDRTLFFFAAFEVDPDETFCEFRTYFAVSILGNDESADWVSFLRFLSFFLSLFLLVLLGYCCYRSRLRGIYRRSVISSRLEEAAWEILFRYERYVTEINAHRRLEAAAEAEEVSTHDEAEGDDFDNDEEPVKAPPPKTRAKKPQSPKPRPSSRP